VIHCLSTRVFVEHPTVGFATGCSRLLTSLRAKERGRRVYDLIRGSPVGSVN